MTFIEVKKKVALLEKLGNDSKFHGQGLLMRKEQSEILNLKKKWKSQPNLDFVAKLRMPRRPPPRTIFSRRKSLTFAKIATKFSNRSHRSLSPTFR